MVGVGIVLDYTLGVVFLAAHTGTQPELTACALFPARTGLFWSGSNDSQGWGLGFVQGEEVLLQKTPRLDNKDLDIYGHAHNLRSDAIVATAGCPPRSTANDVDPYRFRFWLFGMAGEPAGFEAVRERLLQSVPEFLRRNIRGTSASEHVFHLFLAFLHDGGLLDARSPDAGVVRHALRQSVVFLNRLLAPAGGPENPVSLVATTGRTLVAMNQGIPMHYLAIDGISECGCPACPERLNLGDATRRIRHSDLRSVVVSSAPSLSQPPGWSSVPTGQSLLVEMDRRPALVPG